MRQRIQCDLPAKSRSLIAAQLRRQRMRRFVARRGKKKDDVPDEADRDQVRRKIGHFCCAEKCGSSRVGALRPECKASAPTRELATPRVFHRGKRNVSSWHAV